MLSYVLHDKTDIELANIEYVFIVYFQDNIRLRCATSNIKADLHLSARAMRPSLHMLSVTSYAIFMCAAIKFCSL